MIDTITAFAEKYGFFVVGGVIGAIIQRLRTTMTWKKFLSVVAISAFVGFIVGILTKNYLNAPDEVVFVACSVAGVFSKEILDEFQEIISLASDYIRKLLKLNKNNSDSNDNEDDSSIDQLEK